MSEYMKLREEFNKKVKELREDCPHEELTEPQEVYWAYGHTSGYKSRYCERCGKQMYRPKFPATIDQNETTDKIKELLEKVKTKNDR